MKKTTLEVFGGNESPVIKWGDIVLGRRMIGFKTIKKIGFLFGCLNFVIEQVVNGITRETQRERFL